MLSIEHLKKSLGPAALELSDSELLHIRDALWELAAIAYEIKIKPARAKKAQE